MRLTDYESPSHLVSNTSEVFSPGLLFFKEIIAANIAQCLRMAGSPERLRPHVKTHKTREIVRMQLAAGINKHKCATIAEAEMLASWPSELTARSRPPPKTGPAQILPGSSLLQRTPPVRRDSAINVLPLTMTKT